MSIEKKLDEVLFEGQPPSPGPSSDKPSDISNWTHVDTKQMTVGEMIKEIPGIAYVKEVIDDVKKKDYSWEVTQQVMKYAKYLKENPETYKDFPPIQVLDGKLKDGSHRISTIALLATRDPKWGKIKLRVDFYEEK